MGFYVIGIGGTGAKCIEAIIQLASVGLLPTNKLNILFVDADETNGNLQQTQNSLAVYQKCYQLLKGKHTECNWMTTSIQSYPVWSPFAKTDSQKTLSSFFSYDTIKQTKPALANLFDVLYTKDERTVSLEVGFRGRPAIGSGIMTKMDLDSLNEAPWSSFINQIENDAGSGQGARVMLCGSIFGGTGAAGLPTIGRLISNKLEKDGVRESVKLGCVFALPYFNFPRTSSSKEAVHASSDLFLLNAEAALRYYHNQAQQFDVKYLIGNQQFEQLGEFSVGKSSQKNRPHFIEFYAGLAARHFFMNNPPKGVNIISRNQTGVLQWDDLPNSAKVKAELINATRFAFIWLADFQGKLEHAKAKGIKELDGYAWFDKFFRGPKGLFGIARKELPDLSDDRQQEAIKIVNEWCRDFLRWLSDIHQCENERIELFKAREHFVSLDSLKEEKLAHLFFDDPRAKDLLEKDNLVNLKNNLGDLDISKFAEPNQGVAGLAKALYVCCKV